LIVELWEKGYLKGETKTDVVRQAALHFGVGNPTTLLQGLENRKSIKGPRFSSIPPCAKRNKQKKLKTSQH
jgi:hypothetical protein